METRHLIPIAHEPSQGVAGRPSRTPAAPDRLVSRPDDDPGTSRLGLPAQFSAPWRQQVRRRWMMLANDLERVSDPQARAAIAATLEVAREASTARVSLAKWWWGTEVERAWAALREAEEQIFEHDPDRGRQRVDDDVLGHARATLPRDDDRRLALELHRVGGPKDPTAAKSAGAAPKPTTGELDGDDLKHLQLSTLRAAHFVCDRQNQEARFFRNRLLIASVFVTLLTIVLLVVQSRLHGASYELIAAPDGWDRPAWNLLGLLMLFGYVGALITAIPALSKVPADFSPFNLPVQQALLKLVVGALTAVVGIVVVQSGIIDAATSSADSFAELLVLAIVFGAGQQAVTRFVDARAAEILEPPSQ